MHPDSDTIHIGGDEVWLLAQGEESRKLNMTPAKMYLRHLNNVAQLIKTLSGGRVRKILFWDDMLRSMDEDDLKLIDPDLIPVIWNYTADLTGVDLTLMKKYGRSAMFASAFKGMESQYSNLREIFFCTQNFFPQVISTYI